MSLLGNRCIHIADARSGTQCAPSTTSIRIHAQPQTVGWPQPAFLLAPCARHIGWCCALMSCSQPSNKSEGLRQACAPMQKATASGGLCFLWAQLAQEKFCPNICLLSILGVIRCSIPSHRPYFHCILINIINVCFHVIDR